MAQPVSGPLFQIDDVVYVIASAAGRGFLEPLRIDGINFSRSNSQWLYTINVAKAPGAGIIVGDHIQLQRTRILTFSEAELTDYCTALTLKKNYLESQLALTDSQIEASECSDLTT